MSKSRCIAQNCKNAPVDGSRCAVHGGEAAPLGLESSSTGGGETEGASGVRTAGANPAVNASEQAKPHAEGLDPKRCQHVYPEGHAKAGQQCQGWRGKNSEHCPGHSGVGIAASPEAARAAAQAAAQNRQEQAAARSEARKRAQMSLAERAGAFLARDDVQDLVEGRWLQTLRDGSDSDARQLMRDLLDRVYGRPTDRVEMTEGLTPDERAMIEQMRQLAKLPSLSDDELRERLEANDDAG